MPPKISKYLAIAITFSIGGYILTYLCFVYLIPLVTGNPPIILQNKSWIYMVASNFGFAAWAYMESKSALWALAGLVFGCNGLILYYVIKNKYKKS